MTFSLLLRDTATGEFGAAISSSSPAVAARCLNLDDGIGGANSQNVTDPRLGVQLLDQPRAGAAAQQALDAVVATADQHTIDFRQLLVLDNEGRGAVFSGNRALGVYGSAVRQDAIAGGNMLAGTEVLDALVDTALSTSGRIEERLSLHSRQWWRPVARRPVHSAGLAVVADAGWRVTDLRVDWSEDPIGELGGSSDVWLPQRDDYTSRGTNPCAAPPTECPAMSDAPKTRAATRLVKVEAELVALSNQLHDDPETGWQEHRSSAAVAALLARHGFTVTQPYLA